MVITPSLILSMNCSIEVPIKRMLVAVAAVLPAGALRAPGPTSSVSSISVDYPSEGSLFPSDIVAPTFQWRDPDGVRRHGGLRLGSRTRRRGTRLWSQGEKMKLGTRHQPDWSGCALCRERRTR